MLLTDLSESKSSNVVNENISVSSRLESEAGPSANTHTYDP